MSLSRRSVLGVAGGLGMSWFVKPGRGKPSRPTGTPTPTSTPPSGELFGWQLTTSNTGLVGAGIDRTTLATYSGSTTPTAGTTISLKKITSQLNCSNGNITIDRCWIQPSSGSGNIIGTFSGSSWAPNTVLVQDCEIDGSLLSAEDAAFSTGGDGIISMVRNYVHDVGIGGNLHAWPSSLSSLIKHNYFIVNAAFGDPGGSGNHADGFTIRNFDDSPGRTATVQNNRINCNSANATGAFFIQASDSDTIYNVYISGNLLEGNGYQLGLEQKGTPGGIVDNMNLTNNRFSNTGFGAGYVFGGASWDSQSENYVNDPGQPDNKGAPVSF